MKITAKTIADAIKNMPVRDGYPKYRYMTRLELEFWKKHGMLPATHDFGDLCMGMILREIEVLPTAKDKKEEWRCDSCGNDWLYGYDTPADVRKLKTVLKGKTALRCSRCKKETPLDDN